MTEKNFSLFFDVIGAQALCEKIIIDHKKIYEKTNGLFFYKNVKSVFTFSEDTKNDVIEYMRTNSGKWEDFIRKKSMLVVEEMQWNVHVDKVEYQFDKENNIPYMNISYKRRWNNKYKRIHKYPEIEELKNMLEEYLHNPMNIQKKTVSLKTMHKSYINQLLDFIYSEGFEYKKKLLNVYLSDLVNNSDDYFIVIDSIERNRPEILIHFFVKKVPSIHELTETDNSEKSLDTFSLIKERIKEKYGVYMKDFLGRDSTKGKIEGFGYLIKNQVFDSKDISHFLSKPGLKVSQRMDILMSICEIININNFDDFKNIDFKKNVKIARDMDTNRIEHSFSRPSKFYYKKSQGYVNPINRSYDPFFIYLYYGACDSLKIIDFLWHDKASEPSYFCLFLEKYKYLDYHNMEEYMNIHKKHMKTNERHAIILLNGDSFASLCKNNNVSIELIEDFIRLYTKKTNEFFDFKKQLKDLDPIAYVLKNNKNDTDEKYKISLYLLNKGVYFRSSRDICTMFRLYTPSYEDSFKILASYIKSERIKESTELYSENTSENMSDSDNDDEIGTDESFVEFITRTNKKQIDLKGKLTHSNIVKLYKDLERDEDSLVLSICKNDNPNLQFLDYLLEYKMDPNKSYYDQEEDKHSFLLNYIIEKSKIELFALITKYNFSLEETEDELFMLSYACHYNPTLQFSKIFFDYLYIKKCTIPRFCFNFYLSPRLDPAILEMFFTFRSKVMSEDPKLVELGEEDIFGGLLSLAKYSPENMTIEIMRIFIKNSGDSIKTGGGDLLAILAKDKMSSEKIKYLIENKVKIKEMAIKSAINANNKEGLLLLLQNASITIIIKTMPNVRELRYGKEIIYNVLPIVHCRLLENPKDELSKLFPYTSKENVLLEYAFEMFSRKVLDDDYNFPWGVEKTEIENMLENYKKGKIWTTNNNKLLLPEIRDVTSTIFMCLCVIPIFNKKNPRNMIKGFASGNIRMPKPIMSIIIDLVVKGHYEKRKPLENEKGKRMFEENMDNNDVPMLTIKKRKQNDNNK